MINRKIIISVVIKFNFSSEHYKVLGLNRFATKDQIKQAFIELAKKHHPDVSHTQNSQFKEITNAYNILKDPLKKSQYDKSIENNEQNEHQTNYQNYYNSQKNGYSQKNEYSQTYQRQYQHTYTPINWIIYSGIFFILVVYSFSEQSIFKNTVVLPKQLHREEEIKLIFQNKVQDEIERLSQVLQTKDQPKSYQELVGLAEQIENVKSAQTIKSNAVIEQAQMDIRRNNLFLSGEQLNDSPHVVEKRRKLLEEEMKLKKFKIQYETWERVSQGEVCKLVPKSQTKKEKKNKNPEDQNLEDYARAHKIKIHKVDRDFHKPQIIQLRQYEATQDSYM